MSGGETEEKISAWTTDTLKEYLLSKIQDVEDKLRDHKILLDERYKTQSESLATAFLAADKAVQAALISAEKAVAKAENSSDKRFDGVNEFRQTLADQAKEFAERTKDFMSRSEADAKITAIIEKADSLEKANAVAHQLQAQRLSELDQRLSSRLDLTQGKSTGINVAAGIVVAAISVSVGIIGLIITIIAFQ